MRKSELTKNITKDYDPAWSPDMDYIIYTSDRDDNPEIYLMTAAGLDQTNLTNHAGVEMQPSWQP